MPSKELSMREIQEGSLKILQSIDKICNELDLRYFLAYGTLLGAVRHRGFIPWDDDIDIMMPRSDYKVLINYFKTHARFLEPLQLYSYYNDPKYPYMVSRISDSNYYLDIKNEINYGIGLFVDIYPMDGIGNSEKEYTARKNKASLYSSLCFLSSRKHFEIGTTKSRIKKLIKFPAYIYAKSKGKDYFLRKLENMSLEKEYKDSKYVGCLVWGSDGVKAVFPRRWFGGTADIDFEGFKFKAPKEYHKVLKRLYGDYMTIPKKEKQISHHFYKAYKRGE